MVNHIEQIRREITSWDFVSVAPHRFGGIEFNVGKAEIGHNHLSSVMDIPFP
jgi:luciferase-like monooxygenase